MKAETKVQQDIQKYVRKLGGLVIKTQGVIVGTPDLIGSIRVNDAVFPFAVEVKTPDKIDNVSRIQQWRLSQWHSQGWVAFVATSPEDFKAKFEQQAKVELGKI